MVSFYFESVGGVMRRRCGLINSWVLWRIHLIEFRWSCITMVHWIKSSHFNLLPVDGSSHSWNSKSNGLFSEYFYSKRTQLAWRCHSRRTKGKVQIIHGNLLFETCVWDLIKDEKQYWKTIFNTTIILYFHHVCIFIFVLYML